MKFHHFCTPGKILPTPMPSGVEIVLDDVIKNCEFHPLTFKETSNDFRTMQRHVRRPNRVAI